MHTPMQGNEKKAEARRRQRSNRPPNPEGIELLRSIQQLPPSSERKAMVFLWYLYYAIGIICLLFMLIGAAYYA